MFLSVCSAMYRYSPIVRKCSNVEHICVLARVCLIITLSLETCLIITQLLETHVLLLLCCIVVRLSVPTVPTERQTLVQSDPTEKRTAASQTLQAATEGLPVVGFSDGPMHISRPTEWVYLFPVGEAQKVSRSGCSVGY